MPTIKTLNRVGDRVFLDPNPLLSYDELAERSLGSNTYRGFHRIDKDQDGAGAIFRQVLVRKRNLIQVRTNTATSESDLNILLKNVCRTLKKKLSQNIRADQLNSFNKIRKPMDIVIQHMVAMGEDFADARRNATEFLFLPLDSQVFQSDFIFTDQETSALGIKRTYTFKDIESEAHYFEIQDFLREKAKRIGIRHRIYFDLVWNNRYASSGTNLFSTNPR